MTRFALLATLFAAFPLCIRAAEPAPEAVEFFESKVRPLLVEHCNRCHGEKKQQAELRLDTAEGLLKGSDGGAVVVPGDPDKSKLILSVRRVGDYAMPPDKPLPAAAVEVLTQWVKTGAAFPKSAAVTLGAAVTSGMSATSSGVYDTPYRASGHARRAHAVMAR